MKLILQVLTTVALAAVGDALLRDGIIPGKVYGGPHGKKYSDEELIAPGQTVNSITIRSSDRVDSVCLDVTDRSGQNSQLCHGGDGGDEKTLELGEDEHIIGIQAHWGKYYRKTRVMYVKFTTDKGNAIFGGTPTDNTEKKDKEEADDGFQLGGFHGFSGNELDSVGAIWTAIDPLDQSF
ncbi:Jacalin-like lectin domain [Phytophthora cactorum]|nr:Jacalin-like lectin domain [Phytophthora cactorum]